jgi:C4-dicarboxylate-specific signal transduction histidine kinase
MEADRLNTLLEIAGGAAHEINQPLTAILGYAEMAMDILTEDHLAYTYQQHIAEASLRVNGILKRMQAIREYRTRPYADGHQIVDFQQSAQPAEGAEASDV